MVTFLSMRILASLSVFLTVGSFASAQDWTATIPTANTQSLFVDGVQPLMDGGVLVRARWGNEPFWYLLLDAQLSVVDRAYGSASAPLPHAAAAGDGSIALYPYFNDGIAVQPPSRLCWIWKDALGSLDVRTTHDTVGPYADNPQERRLDAAGMHYGFSYWAGPSALVGFEPDCNARFFAAPWRSPNAMAAVPTEEAAYFAGYEDDNTLITRVDGKSVTWTRSLGDPEPAYGIELRATPDGGLLVSQFTHSSAPAAHLKITRLDRAGTTRWTRTYEARPLPAMLHSDGDVTLVAFAAAACTATAQATVQAIDGAGNELWRQTLPACHVRSLYDADPVRTPLIADSNGKVWSTTPSGLQPFAEAVAGHEPLSRAADGTLLLARGEVTDGVATLAARDAQAGVRNIALDAPVPTAPVAAFHDAGGAFVVTRDETGRAELIHFSPAGDTRWRRQLFLPGALPNETGHGHFTVEANDDRLCIWHQPFSNTIAFRSHLACFDRAAGTALFAWVELPFDYGGSAPTLSVRGDGSVDALGVGCYFEPLSDTCYTRARRFLLDRTGQRLRTDEYGNLGAHSTLAVQAVAAATSGSVAVFDNPPSGTRIAVHGRDGAVRWSRASSVQVRPLVLFDDDALFMHTEDRFELRDTRGELRWTYRLPASATVLPSDVRAVALPDGDLFLLASTWQGQRFRTRLQAATGEAKWTVADQAQSSYDYLSEIEISADGASAFLVPRWFADQRLLVFSTSDGSVRGAAARRIPPPMKDGAAAGSVGPDGSLLLAQGHPSEGRTQVEFRAASRQRVGAMPASDLFPGTWHAQDAPGQGFAFHQDAGVLHGGWFTYTRTGGHAASEQRWYTLVGDSAFESSGTALAIYKSAPGNFAAGPGSGSHRVGSATLSALGCHGLLLEYRFHEGEQEGRSGVTPLTPVGLPEDCDQDAPPASESSGAWYDPQAGGQGLLLEIRGPTGTSPGRLAGGWFTFDAQSQFEDDSTLHWFTLVGSATSVETDPVHATIYRTVGGRLDAEPTNNTWAVGRAVFTRTACDRATLEYEFVDATIAHGFRGKRGLLQLSRVTPCAPAAGDQAMPARETKW